MALGKIDEKRKEYAIRLLEKRGYVQSGDLRWVSPRTGYTPASDERYAISYLVRVWGWGGLFNRPPTKQTPTVVQYGGAY